MVITRDELNSKRLKAREERAFLKGKIEAVREKALDSVRNNTSLSEFLRHQAWAESGFEEIGYQGDHLIGAPDGWPEGVDQEEYIRQHVTGEVDQIAPEKFTTKDNTDADEGPLVKQFKESLGDDGDGLLDES